MIKLRFCIALFVGLGIVGSASAETFDDPSAGTSMLVPDEAALRAEGEGPGVVWTHEQMQNAQPATAPTKSRIIGEDEIRFRTEPVPLAEPPGVAPGWSPRSNEPPPSPDTYYDTGIDDTRAASTSDTALRTYGSAPVNPKDGPYGPFQRWSMQGKYLAWPRSVHGKLFYQKFDGSTFVCSATVINRSTIATAAHCVTDGAGNWYSNFYFCPSYLQTGENPQVGCWGWSSVVAPTTYLTTGNIDYDYACIVTAVSGTVVNDKVGNVTGWIGRAWNYSSQQPIQLFGYPAAAPFNGAVIQQVATTEWYESDRIPGGQQSKYVGSDLPGGSSGGGWFLSWRHPDTEFADTDGTTATDPGGAQNGPFLNGVTSHSRCQIDCSEPPTAAAGVFWQELGSSPFLNTAATGESEDVFAACFSDVNNNP